MKKPQQSLADARILVKRLERQLCEARAAELAAEHELALTEADTIRPPLHVPTHDASVDGGWL